MRLVSLNVPSHRLQRQKNAPPLFPSNSELRRDRTLCSVSKPNNLMEDAMTRRAFYHTLSPADRITIAKWTRGVAAVYASIALVTLIGVAAAHYRGEGTQTQIVNLRPLQMN